MYESFKGIFTRYSQAQNGRAEHHFGVRHIGDHHSKGERVSSKTLLSNFKYFLESAEHEHEQHL